MTVRARLFARAVRALLALTLLLAAPQAMIPSLRPLALHGLYFGAVLGGALALAHRGYARVSIALTTLVGGGSLLWYVWSTGGTSSRYADFLPLFAISIWAWLGRRAGLFAVVASTVALSSPMPTAADGELVAVTLHVIAIALGALFVGLVSRDLRETAALVHGRAERAERAAVTAAHADASRDRFLEMVSHELRTPLDVVLGYAALLREEEVDPERARDLDRITAAGMQLLSLLDDVLDMSRLQADEISIKNEPVAIGDLVAEVIETVGPLAARRDDRLVSTVAPDVPVLHSDRRRIRQIMLNLLSNSAKYTTGGEIRLDVSLAGERLVLAVRDTGIGIPRDRLDQLFQPFVQLHEGLDRRPGIGLGLALSQRLAERLGGRIEAESEVGVGSTFTLVVPLDGTPPGCEPVAARG